jgi:hypothetical protein
MSKLPKYQGKKGSSEIKPRRASFTSLPGMGMLSVIGREAQRQGLTNQYDIRNTMLNPKNWFPNDYSKLPTFDKAYQAARQQGEKEFIWKGKRYSGEYAGTPEEQLRQTGITNEQLQNKSFVDEKLHRNLNPVGYGSIPRMLNRLGEAIIYNDPSRTREMSDQYAKKGRPDKQRRLDAWYLYQGYPQRFNTFSISKNKPSASENNNASYYSINNPKIQNELLNLIKIKPKEDVLVFPDAPLEEYKKEAFDRDAVNNIMGRYKLGLGKDDKGKYISYYDNWDLAPISQNVNMDYFGKPFEIYDRIYYKDENGKAIPIDPSEAYRKQAFQDLLDAGAKQAGAGSMNSIPVIKLQKTTQFVPKKQSGGWLSEYDLPKYQGKTGSGQILQQRYGVGPMMGDLARQSGILENLRQAEIRKTRPDLEAKLKKEKEQLAARARYEAMPKIGPARERNYSEQVQAEEQRRRLNQQYADQNPEVTTDESGNIVPSKYGRFMQTYGPNLDKFARSWETPLVIQGVGELAYGVGKLGARYLPQLGEYLTTQTPLKNTYKINPWAFKGREGFKYRGLGEEGVQDALESGVFRAKQNVEPFRISGFDIAKRFDKAYYSPKFNTAAQYGDGFIAEVPELATTWKNRYNKSNWSQIAKTDIPVLEGRILQKDWLRGYKEMPTVYRDVNRIDRSNLGKYLDLSADISGGQGAYNLGIYPFKRDPRFLFKVGVNNSGVFSQMMPKMTDDIVQLTKDLDPSQYAKVYRNISLTGVNPRLFKQVKKAASLPREYELTGTVIPRLEGKSISDLSIPDLAQMEGLTISRYLEDVANLDKKGIAFDIFGENALYNPKQNTFSFIDLFPKKDVKSTLAYPYTRKVSNVDEILEFDRSRVKNSVIDRIRSGIINKHNEMPGEYSDEYISELLRNLEKARTQIKKSGGPVVNSNGYKDGRPSKGSNWRIPGNTVYNPTGETILAQANTGEQTILQPYDTNSVTFQDADYIDEYHLTDSQSNWLDDYKAKLGGPYNSSWMLTNPKPEPVYVPKMQQAGEPERLIQRDYYLTPASGTRRPIYTSDPRDPRLRSYQDSLSLYNTSRAAIGNFAVSEKNTPVYLRKGVSPKILNSPEFKFLQGQGYNLSGRFEDNMNPNNNFPAPKVKQTIMPIGGIGISEGNSMGGWYDIYKKPVQPVEYRKRIVERPTLKPLPNIELTDVRPAIAQPTFEQAKVDMSKPTKYSYTYPTFDKDVQKTMYFPDRSSWKTFVEQQRGASSQEGKDYGSATGQFATGGNLLSKSVTCPNCGHSWKGADGGTDALTCHKCGSVVKMQNGGWLREYQDAGPIMEDTFTPYSRNYLNNLRNEWVATYNKPIPYRIPRDDRFDEFYHEKVNTIPQYYKTIPAWVKGLGTDMEEYREGDKNIPPKSMGKLAKGYEWVENYRTGPFRDDSQIREYARLIRSIRNAESRKPVWNRDVKFKSE